MKDQSRNGPSIHGQEERRAVDLLIFDLDCTLADTKLDIALATNYALRALGLPQLPPQTIYGYIGNGVEKILERALPSAHQHLRDEALRLFSEHYGQHLLDHTRLYPKVRETLEHFRTKKMAVATNKTLRFSLQTLEGLQIRHYFQLVLGGDSTDHLKPNPEPLQRILQALQVTPHRAAMVGDSVSDVLAGKRAGTLTCALTYGLGKREDLLASGPDYLADDFGALVHFFE
jgi:2-phosphoglycolate phosphatase